MSSHHIPTSTGREEAVKDAHDGSGTPQARPSHTAAPGPLAGEVLVTSPAAFVTLLRAVLREELAAYRPEPTVWLDREGVAVLLGYQPGYISELVRKHGLPAHGPRRKPRFNRGEVLRWADQRGRRHHGSS